MANQTEDRFPFKDWDTTVTPPPPKHYGLKHFAAWVKARRYNQKTQWNGPQFWYGPLDGTPVKEEIKDHIEVPLADGQVARYDKHEDAGYVWKGYVNA